MLYKTIEGLEDVDILMGGITQMKLNKRSKRIITEVIIHLKEIGMEKEKDFYIFAASEGTRKGILKFLKIQFRLKGNKKVIEYLKSKGWEHDKRYKNEDGNPSIWASDIHGKVFSQNSVMERMKFNLIIK